MPSSTSTSTSGPSSSSPRSRGGAARRGSTAAARCSARARSRPGSTHALEAAWASRRESESTTRSSRFADDRRRGGSRARDAYDEGILELAQAAGGRMLAFAVGEDRDGFAGDLRLPARLVAEGELAESRAAGSRSSSTPASAPAARGPAGLVDSGRRVPGADAGGLRVHLARGGRSVPVIFAFLAGGAPFQLERLARAARPRSRRGDLLRHCRYGSLALGLAVRGLRPGLPRLRERCAHDGAQGERARRGGRGRRGSLRRSGGPCGLSLTPLEEATARRPAAAFSSERTRTSWARSNGAARCPSLEAYAGEGPATIITASTGNHGAATAWAAQRVGMRAIVFATGRASRTKLANIGEDGADTRQTGADFDEAKAEARVSPSQRRCFSWTASSPISTTGTARSRRKSSSRRLRTGRRGRPAREWRAAGRDRARHFATRTDMERIGVVAKERRDGAVLGGRRAGSRRAAATFADGLAVRVAIPLALEVLGEVVTRMVQVSERESPTRSASTRRSAFAPRAPRPLRSPPSRSSRTSRPARARRDGPQHRRRALHPRRRSSGNLPGLSGANRRRARASGVDRTAR